jgi:hypothetical protein
MIGAAEDVYAKLYAWIAAGYGDEEDKKGHEDSAALVELVEKAVDDQSVLNVFRHLEQTACFQYGLEEERGIMYLVTDDEMWNGTSDDFGNPMDLTMFYDTRKKEFFISDWAAVQSAFYMD